MKAQYFPGNNDMETLRPLFAAGQMSDVVLAKNALVVRGNIMDKINTMVGQNRHIRTTATELNMKLEGGYSEITKRAEAMINSLSFDNEIACIDQQLNSLEHDIESLQGRANDWAEGHIDALRDSKFELDGTNPCMLLLVESSEKATAQDMVAHIQQRWLTAAEKALATNHSTFAVLDIGALVSENGLLVQLKQKGYAVREPGLKGH